MPSQKFKEVKAMGRKKIWVYVLEFWDPFEREKFQVEVKHENEEVARREASKERKAYENEGYQFIEQWKTWEWGAA